MVYGVLRLLSIVAVLLVTLHSRPVNALVSALINEVVTDPQQDWSDSSGGVPFDDVPGVGAPSVDDEWIEIVNGGASTLDLGGWTLEMRDGSDATLTISPPSGAAHFVYSAGCTSSSFSPGCALVIGDPTGTLSNAVHLVLRDASATLVDQVEFGDDPQGDGAGDGAPDGNASSTADESVARFPHAVDRDQDPLDFEKQAVSIGTSNGNPNGVVINEVVTDPQQDWSDSVEGDGVPFNDVPGTGIPSTDDQWIEFSNHGALPVNLTGWSVEMWDTTPSDDSLSSPSGGVVVAASPGCSTQLFEPGCRVVLGNPTGSMDDDVWIVLVDQDGAVDQIEIGDDPAGDGAGDGAADGSSTGGAATGFGDESVQRSPDGADTDDDVADFVQGPATIPEPNARVTLALGAALIVALSSRRKSRALP